MANLKLSYTLEELVTKGSEYKIKSWVDTSKYVLGKEFNEEYFLPYGDKYIKSDRIWEQMASDEYHALFYSVIKHYGWKCMIGYIKEYKKLVNSNLGIPSGSEAKVQLICAVLEKVTPESIMQQHKTYTLPINTEIITEQYHKYKLN